jgi:NAD(P)-dependent dehydrogenase (short-subunit alcohol dehydrogenase family)
MKRQEGSNMEKNVMLWAGAGQIGMAIARRVGAGKKIIVGDKKLENAQAIAKTMNDAGFDVVPMEMDLSSRASIQALIAEGQKYGPITDMVIAAGVSPSQAPIETILKVDLYGSAVMMEEVGKVIAPGGSGVMISSQSGWRMPALTAQEDALLATTPTEELLDLDILHPELSSRPWPSTNSTVPAAISTKICSPTVPRAVPARRTR